MSKNAYVVAIGNAFDGLVLYGPHKTAELANEWAERHARHDEWVVVELVKTVIVGVQKNV
jgi:hypothetical protein